MLLSQSARTMLQNIAVTHLAVHSSVAQLYQAQQPLAAKLLPSTACVREKAYRMPWHIIAAHAQPPRGCLRCGRLAPHRLQAV